MESCLYTGQVGHQRLTPVAHCFRYSVFFLYLDLAELGSLFAGRWLWSVEEPNWASFRRSDHFRPESLPLERAVRDEVERQLGRAQREMRTALKRIEWVGGRVARVGRDTDWSAEGARPHGGTLLYEAVELVASRKLERTECSSAMRIPTILRHIGR